MQIVSRYRSVIVPLVITVILLLTFINTHTEDAELLPTVGSQLGEELEFSQDPLLSLVKLAMIPPPAPVSSSCLPPSLPAIPSCQAGLDTLALSQRQISRVRGIETEEV